MSNRVYIDMGRLAGDKSKRSRGWYLSCKQAFAIVNYRRVEWWIGAAVDQDKNQGYSVFFLDPENTLCFLPLAKQLWSTADEARAAAQEFFASGIVLTYGRVGVLGQEITPPEVR